MNINELDKLVDETNKIASDTTSSFGQLSTPQLNWKPSAERWSIAECFEHLLTTNKSYFLTFDEILSGHKKTRFMERLPVLPTIWGNLLKKSLDPASTRKLKSPGRFAPTNSDLDPTVLREFVDQQQVIADYITRMKGFDLDRMIVTSPALSLVTYNAMDAFRIMVIHEHRHLLQATNVLRETAFPHEAAN